MARTRLVRTTFRASPYEVTGRTAACPQRPHAAVFVNACQYLQELPAVCSCCCFCFVLLLLFSLMSSAPILLAGAAAREGYQGTSPVHGAGIASDSLKGTPLRRGLGSCHLKGVRSCGARRRRWLCIVTISDRSINGNRHCFCCLAIFCCNYRRTNGPPLMFRPRAR